MSPDDQLIVQDPNFQRLRRQRQRLRVALAALLVALYLGFALLALYAPGWLGAPLRSGSVISIGIPLAYAIILISIVSSAAYVHWANTRFDSIERQVKEALKKKLGR